MSMKDTPTTEDICGFASRLKILPDDLATYDVSVVRQNGDALLILDQRPNFDADYEEIDIKGVTKFTILLEDYVD